MEFVLSEYDPSWPVTARAAIRELTTALGDILTRVEHIGSTSVPGLVAKPVIDLMAATGQPARVVRRGQDLRRLGYALVETGMPERLLFRRDGDPVAYHLHVVTEASWDDRNERLLRDHLLECPADVVAYAALKRELVAAGSPPQEYTRAKTDLVQRMVDDARTRRGLPLVPVWED